MHTRIVETENKNDIEGLNLYMTLNRGVRSLSLGGGEKIKEQHVPGRGTFFARGACEIISRAKRAKNFSPPSRVFRPPP